ncbi:MAG: DUF5367 domain-containing protein [Cyanomargarita calcarea GSE-NOS-MK-12-04C]|uniref:DUF5367 domain-containing protein n=1 Tax=Cyanomargarita calcarea GSE-NOS-MK-12-04C TaxID=2839659 RepID=A0A951QWR5_9CYAN|nr:DUF5367 domain-containing protein [Cyanomargarita calcarea GSE-NOS-MK-12-04C]
MSFFIWLGFLLWFVATVAVRLIGQFLFNPETSNLLLTFVAAVPLMAAITYSIYSWRKVEAKARLMAIMYVLLPGMMLDTFTVLFASDVFPNLTSEGVRIFSACLLWAYGLGFMTAFIPKSSVDNIAV